ncbi:MAG TPA: hypothetical protein VF247_06005 [Candidatus Krumholzibacteria bacterium]
MNVGRSINRYLDALSYTRSAFGAPGVFLPFAMFGLLQALILLLFAQFTHPLLAPVMVPVMRWLGGEASLHYPMHLVGLPSVYQRVYLPLVASAGFALWSFAVWKLVDHHAVGADRPRRDFRPALPHIVVIGVLFVLASVVTGEAASRLVGPRTPDTVQRAVLFASVLATASLQALLVYAPLALRVRGGGWRSAVATSVAYARRHFIATAMVLLTVLLIHWPVDFILSRADRLAARFQPETIVQVMLASAVLEMFTACLLFAAITELALPREGGLK